MPNTNTDHQHIPKTTARVTKDEQGQQRIEVTYYYYFHGLVVRHVVWADSHYVTSLGNIMLWCRDKITDKPATVFVDAMLYNKVRRQLEAISAT